MSVENIPDNTLSPKEAINELQRSAEKKFKNKDYISAPSNLYKESEIKNLQPVEGKRHEVEYLLHHSDEKEIEKPLHFEPANSDFFTESPEKPTEFTESSYSVVTDTTTIECTECSGTGRVDCYKCGGSGNVDCPVDICRHGQLYEPCTCDNDSYCPNCGGAGVIQHGQCNTCTDNPPIGKIECRDCSSPDHKNECRTCEGRGEALRVDVTEHQFEVRNETIERHSVGNDIELSWKETPTSTEEFDSLPDLDGLAPPSEGEVLASRVREFEPCAYELNYSIPEGEHRIIVLRDRIVPDYYPRGSDMLEDWALAKFVGRLAVIFVVVYLIGVNSGGPRISGTFVFFIFIFYLVISLITHLTLIGIWRWISGLR